MRPDGSRISGCGRARTGSVEDDMLEVVEDVDECSPSERRASLRPAFRYDMIAGYYKVYNHMDPLQRVRSWLLTVMYSLNLTPTPPLGRCTPCPRNGP